MSISILLIIIFAQLIFGELFNLTDISKCKLSHLGLEFTGDISKTEGGVRCQSWTASRPIHKIDSAIVNEMFPERSMQAAKSYCRNPLRKEDGPWCYSMEEDLIDDTCGIPLCSFTECKLTGPGMDYGGRHSKASSGKRCLKWDKRRKKVRDTTGGLRVQEKFSKRKFPDETRGDAKKYCRNPDGDPGGPWCFVDSEEGGGVVEKHYCDIPFCDDQDCVTFTGDSETYTHYTLLNGSITNLTFGIKLWNPDEVFGANARLLLSLFALPLTGEEIDDLHIGIEIYISNKDSAMTVGNKDTPEYEPTVGVLKSSDFTFFTLMWSAGFVTLSLQDQAKPIFLAEYKSKKGLFGENRDRFFFYSMQGTNLLWSLPFCDEEDECEVHSTTGENYERFWPLRRTNSSHDVQFFVRAFHSASILFQPSPTVKWPGIKLTLYRKADNVTKVALFEINGAPETDLKSTTVLNLLDFWEWHEFTVAFFADTLQIFWYRDDGTQLIAEIKSTKASSMRWFSPGSDDTLAHWTFFCSAGEAAAPPPPWPPECVLSKEERGYVGTQSVTSSGHPCLPWTYDEKIETEIGKKKMLKYWNYCRDPSEENLGTFCYAVKRKPEKIFEKEKCELRLCKSSECRMAGTGNDYIGKLNTTRSNRTCQSWTLNKPQQVDEAYLNGSLYADQNASIAENYCRDPSRNIAGPWCYTTDPATPKDLCNVRDCSYSEECIVMTKGNGSGRGIYILPEWKEAGIHGGLHFALKEWNPDLLDGIIFEIVPLDDKPGFIRLVIGAEDNERVLVYYSSLSESYAKLVSSKTLPHLIPAGKWGKFWLQMRRGELELGHEGASDPLFSWQYDKPAQAFEPGFLTYMSIEDNIIGVHFRCSECHTERTTTQVFTRIMPLSLWSETEQTVTKNLSLYLRGTGVALVPLILLPNDGYTHALAIGDLGTYIIFLLNKDSAAETLVAKNLKKPVFYPNKWTRYLITFTEKKLEVFRNNVSVLTYHSNKTLLFYWFSIGAEKGWVTWAANCEPPDIDGPPRDGGWSAWSPWTCTVSCGGGDGFRTRKCNNPKPNLKGKLCQGPHTSTGRCNEFECGDLSPETMDKIRERLRTEHTSFVVDEGERVVIENSKDLLTRIQSESPKSYYQWTRNGVYIKPISHQVEIVNDNIIIHKANTARDTGVYVCVVYRVNGVRLILRVATVAVRSSKPDLVTRATLEMTLVSNAAVLGYIYTDLAQAWLLNNTVFLDYGITTLAARVSERFGPLNISNTGLWSCRVTQKDLRLSWITNVVHVQVKTAPNWLSHLMEDQFTAPIFGLFGSESGAFAALITIVVLVFVLVFCGLIFYLKYGTLPKRQYKRLNKS